jgi:site-specific DNA recombinase
MVPFLHQMKQALYYDNIRNVQTYINDRDLLFGSYCRKSSDTEDKQVQSIETQERELNDFSTRMGLNVALAWKEEKSAFKVGRDTFAEVIKAINTRQINALIVIHPNRIARNPIDGAVIIDCLDRGCLLCVKTPTRTYYNTSIDKMMLGLEFLFSKRDSDDKSAFVKNGQKTKAIKGYPHGVAAIGFLNDKTEDKGNRKWVVDPVKYPIIAKMMQMFLSSGWSANGLARHMREEFKLTTQKHKKIGGSLVTVSRVHEMLKDPIYAGFFYQGGQRYDLNKSLPRMITEDQHRKILRMLSSRNLPKVKTHLTTFAGFVRSPEGHFVGPDIKLQVICDCRLKFAYSNKTNCPRCTKPITDIEKPKYLEYVYYSNITRKKNYLPTKSVREDSLKSFVIDYFTNNLQLSPALAEWSKKFLHESKDREFGLERALFAQAKEEIAAVEKRKKRIIQMMADDAIPQQDGRSALEELNKCISASNVKKSFSNGIEEAIKIANLTREFVAIMESDDTRAKRAVLSEFGSNLVWNEKELSITNTKWVDVLAGGLKEAKRENPRFEPKNIVDTSDSNEVFASIRPILLRTWDDVRIAINEFKGLSDRN